MSRTRAEDLLSSPIGLQLLELIAHRDAPPAVLLSELPFYVSRHRGDYDEHVAWLRTQAGALAVLAEWLPKHMPGWWADLDRANQVWASRTSDFPEPSRFIIDLAAMDREASKPRRAFWTSTRTLPSVSPWLNHPERPDVVHLWRLIVTDTARVAEIHSPEHWSAFVRGYPSAMPGLIFTGVKHPPSSAQRLDPDWSKVAADWDGVHLSVGGWLTAEDVPYESGGVITELRGWDVESTAWFRWSFDDVEPIDLH